jgi:indole-3-glycerol phosphate synthase
VSDVLDAIVAKVRARLMDRVATTPLAVLAKKAKAAPAARDLAAALRRPGETTLIAELKRASPSEGPILLDLDAASFARAYEECGAAALSVLTEPDFFRGSLHDLDAARRATKATPILRKDFVVDGYQLVEARASGADAVLLIARVLEGERLSLLLRAARELELQALVEARDEREIELALEAGAAIVGVNNRDLATLEVDPTRAERLRARIPSTTVAVWESGIRTADDVRRARAAGYDAVLVGTALSKAKNPAELARELVLAGRSA